jgi:hypothetical protein
MRASIECMVYPHMLMDFAGSSLGVSRFVVQTADGTAHVYLDLCRNIYIPQCIERIIKPSSNNLKLRRD